jgi:hypothetical protein
MFMLSLPLQAVKPDTVRVFFIMRLMHFTLILSTRVAN